MEDVLLPLDYILPLDYKELSGSTQGTTAHEGWATRYNMGVSSQTLPLAMTSTLEGIQENWTPVLASSVARCRVCR